MRLRRLVAVLISFGILAWGGARSLSVSEPASAADAILVLSGAPVYDERLRYAASLYRAGIAPVILLSDDGQLQHWSRRLQKNPRYVDAGRDLLVGSGVPAAHIEILPGQVHGTYDEAVNAVAYARAHNVHRLLAVTSRHHTRRTLWTLRQVAGPPTLMVSIDQVPTPSPGTPGDATWWLIPDGWGVVAGEFVKLPYYWIRYGLLRRL